MTTVIVDYEMGNLRSVQKAVERLGEAARITSDPQEIAEAQRVILPGVGAFRDAIAALRSRGLTEVIRDHIEADRPFLGICLGLQMLLDRSFEDGEYAGLGIVPGDVVKFELPAEYKVPHMGWNQLIRRDGIDVPLLDGLSADEWFYFVHSYYVVPADSDWIAAEADYGGNFCAVIGRGRVFATQFHPEKSQHAGRRLLENFLEIPAH